jgi:2-polyprenyl-6-hydroxyphenyl methylase/3-demethylubiquinone-9 3-methyltransferase
MNIWGRVFKALSVIGWSDSLEPYYAATDWNEKYAVGYQLDIAFEACRYACVSALVAHFAKGGAVLDLGCGNGVLAKYIRALSSARLVAVDYSQQGIDQAVARAIPDCEFVCADIRTFQPSEAYSLIVFNESLYYLKDGADILRSYSRYLLPDGVYLISMFRTPLTKRAWRKVGEFGGKVLHENIIEDAKTRHQWVVRVVSPTHLQAKCD